mgnify:FL=1
MGYLKLKIGVGVACVLAYGPVSKWAFYDSQGQEPTSVQLRRKFFDPIDKSKLFRDIQFSFWDQAGVHFGLLYYDHYFNDTAAYEFHPDLAVQLAQATFDLHNMCLDAVDTVISSKDLMDLFEIPESLRPEIIRSWKEKEPDLLGRFDFLIDANNMPRLIEYNADTPTLLLESSKAQGIWAKEKKLADRQFNFLIDALTYAWRQVVSIEKYGGIYFFSSNSFTEERENANVLYQTAKEAGFWADKRDISDLKIDKQKGSLVTSQGNEVDCLWKLYPWEWIANEEVSEFFAPNNRNDHSKTKVLEPAWKAILSNKSLLAVLWQLYPNHPNLVPAFFSIPSTYSEFENNMFENSQHKWIAKPKFGRGGENIKMSTEFGNLKDFLESTGAGNAELVEDTENSNPQKLSLGDYVIQQYVDSPTHRGRYASIGSWVVFGAPVGFCVREDTQPVIKEHSNFVPSYIGGTGEENLFGNFDPHPFSSSQRKFRQGLYGKAGDKLLEMIFRGAKQGENEWRFEFTYEDEAREEMREDGSKEERKDGEQSRSGSGGGGARWYSGGAGGSGQASTGSGQSSSVSGHSSGGSGHSSGGGYIPIRWGPEYDNNKKTTFAERLEQAKAKLQEKAKKINEIRQAQLKSQGRTVGRGPVKATGSTAKTFGGGRG